LSFIHSCLLAIIAFGLLLVELERLSALVLMELAC